MLVVEALHVANLLHTHGFLFGIDVVDGIVIKDDSTLFRFQASNQNVSACFPISCVDTVSY